MTTFKPGDRVRVTCNDNCPPDARVADALGTVTEPQASFPGLAVWVRLDTMDNAQRFPTLLHTIESVEEVNGPPCCTVCDSWLDGGNETGVCDYCSRDPYLDGSR